MPRQSSRTDRPLKKDLESRRRKNKQRKGDIAKPNRFENISYTPFILKIMPDNGLHELLAQPVTQKA